MLTRLACLFSWLLICTSCADHVQVSEQRTGSKRVDFKPTMSDDFRFTINDGVFCKLMEVSQENGKAVTNTIDFFPPIIDTVLGRCSDHSYLGTARAKELDSTFLVWITGGALTKVLGETGSRVERIAFLPKTSQIIQLESPINGCGCSDCDTSSYYINLFNIPDDLYELRLQRVAHVQLPWIPGRCDGPFKLARDRPIFCISDSDADPFVAEVVGDEIRVLSATDFEMIEPHVSYDFDLLPEKEWIIFSRITSHTQGSEYIDELEITLSNWRTGKIIGATYREKVAQQLEIPIAFVDEHTIAIATKDEFVVLSRQSEDQVWKRISSQALDFPVRSPTDIRIVGDHSAVVVSSIPVNPDIPSSYAIVNF